MDEYIERQAAIEAFENGEADVIENYGDGCDFGFGIKNIKDVLSAIPAADAAPVRHGEWTKAEDDWNCMTTITCSECHEEWCFETEEDVSLLNYRYCPNCGARMGLGGADNG